MNTDIMNTQIFNLYKFDLKCPPDSKPLIKKHRDTMMCLISLFINEMRHIIVSLCFFMFWLPASFTILLSACSIGRMLVFVKPFWHDFPSEGRKLVVSSVPDSARAAEVSTNGGQR